MRAWTAWRTVSPPACPSGADQSRCRGRDLRTAPQSSPVGSTPPAFRAGPQWLPRPGAGADHDLPGPGAARLHRPGTASPTPAGLPAVATREADGTLAAGHRRRDPTGRRRGGQGVTGVDDHSRFCVIATVVRRATGRAVCLALSGALQRFGIPDEVLTDNGKQFTGRFNQPRPAEVMFERICRENGIVARNTKPRTPTTATCGGRTIRSKRQTTAGRAHERAWPAARRRHIRNEVCGPERRLRCRSESVRRTCLPPHRSRAR
jgi:hypothetical protein